MTQRVFVGAKATWVMLDMGRSLSEGDVESRNGSRTQLGGTVGLRW